MFLKNNSPYPIGLDISDMSVKMVQLNKIRDKIKIQAISRVNFSRGVITNGEIKKPEELIKAIKKAVASPLFGKASSQEVVACLPESKTFVKLIEVQKSPNSLSDVMGSEIEKHVPLAITDVYYDWQIIEELADKYLVLIGAAPKDIVNQYTAILDETKLTPVALEVEPVAVVRCLLKEEVMGKTKGSSQSIDKAAANYGLIDIGADHTSMVFYSSNTILFTVSMPISGEEITAKIAKALNLNDKQAEKAKIICGMDGSKANGVIREILAETVKNLVEKVKESIQYYENYFAWRGPLNKILLCGGGANILNLAEIMAEELKLETKIADALVNLNESKEKFEEYFTEKHKLDLRAVKINSKTGEQSLAVRQNTNSTYATAIGLALRGIIVDEI